MEIDQGTVSPSQPHLSNTLLYRVLKSPSNTYHSLRNIDLMISLRSSLILKLFPPVS